MQQSILTTCTCVCIHASPALQHIMIDVSFFTEWIQQSTDYRMHRRHINYRCPLQKIMILLLSCHILGKRPLILYSQLSAHLPYIFHADQKCFLVSKESDYGNSLIFYLAQSDENFLCENSSPVQTYMVHIWYYCYTKISSTKIMWAKLMYQ